MMLVEPNQKKVAMTASPRCGFVGLNPLMTNVPLWLSAPLTWSRAMPDPGDTSNAGGLGTKVAGGEAPWRPGLTDSLQPAASSATASGSRTGNWARRDITPPPCGHSATH